MSTDEETAFVGAVPPLAAFLGRLFLPYDVGMGGIAVLMACLCGLVILLTLNEARKGHGTALMGLTVGATIAAALMSQTAADLTGIAAGDGSTLIFAFIAVMIGFPFALLVADGATGAGHAGRFLIGALGCGYIAGAFGLLHLLGLTHLILDPFSPTFQFGTQAGLTQGAAFYLNALGTVVATVIDLLLLGAPALLVLGVVTAVQAK